MAKRLTRVLVASSVSGSAETDEVLENDQPSGCQKPIRIGHATKPYSWMSYGGADKALPVTIEQLIGATLAWIRPIHPCDSMRTSMSSTGGNASVRVVLVHGGFHGAWCWEKTIPALRDFGVSVVAVDFPGCGEKLGEQASLNSWRTCMYEVIQEGDVLVGHSMGGLAISLGADAAPEKVARLVYLAGSVPLEGGTIGGSSAGFADGWSASVGLPIDEIIEVVDSPRQGPCIRITSQRAANVKGPFTRSSA